VRASLCALDGFDMAKRYPLSALPRKVHIALFGRGCCLAEDLADAPCACSTWTSARFITLSQSRASGQKAPRARLWLEPNVNPIGGAPKTPVFTVSGAIEFLGENGRSGGIRTHDP
jgi:hypothetical protein